MVKTIILSIGAVAVLAPAPTAAPVVVETAAIDVPAAGPIVLVPAATLSRAMFATGDHRCLIKKIGDADKILLQEEEEGGFWLHLPGYDWPYSSSALDQCEEDCEVLALQAGGECQETVDRRD